MDNPRVLASPILGKAPPPRDCASSRRSLARGSPKSRRRSAAPSPRRAYSPPHCPLGERPARSRSRSPVNAHRLHRRSRSPSRRPRTSRQPRSRSRCSGSERRGNHRYRSRSPRQREFPVSRSRSPLRDGSRHVGRQASEHLGFSQHSNAGRQPRASRSPRSTWLRNSRQPSSRRRSSPRHSTRRSRRRSTQHEPQSVAAVSDQRQPEMEPEQPAVAALEKPETGGNATVSNVGSGDSLIDSSMTGHLNLLLQTIKSLIPEHNKIGSFNNTVPEFDPAEKGQTMAMWIHKVNECALIYSWNEKQVVHYALPKLKGVAKRWYEGLPSVLFSWDEWQTKLLAAFPSEENYGQTLSDMLAKRARYGDSLEEYFYDKISLINRCNITGKRAVECVLHGIDDRAVRLGAEAAQYEDLDKLLTYLRNSRSSKQNLDRKTTNKNQSLVSSSESRAKNAGPKDKTLRCNNCKQEGHFVGQCPQPIKKCSKCQRIGHVAEQCFSKTVKDEKSVNRVTNNSSVSDKYYKTVRVNGIEINSFVDLGSECSMLKQSELHRLGDIQVETSELPVLRGFGNSTVQVLGRIIAEIEIDGVIATVEILIVPDNVMQVPLMVGQTFTEQSHVLIKKTNEHFEILNNEFNDILLSNKVKALSSKTIHVSGLMILEVYTQPEFKGELYIEGGVRNRLNYTHFVPAGIYQFYDEGHGRIVINNLGTEPLLLRENTVIARGIVAYQEKDFKVLNVSANIAQDRPMSPICKNDLNTCGKLDPAVIDKLLALLNRYRHCFAFSLSELGHSSICEMSIDLHSGEPVVYRPYRLAMKEKEVVRQMVTELLENDIIRPSVSPFASPIVLVRKKTGEYRLCIDYRALNKNTVRENYPMPLIDDQIDRLAGNTFFTALDLASGYYQISIKEQDRHKTAFVTPEGHFEFNRMPFGLANAPATFQRMIHQVLGNLRHKEAMAYLDDIIIPSRTIEEGMQRNRIERSESKRWRGSFRRVIAATIYNLSCFTHGCSTGWVSGVLGNEALTGGAWLAALPCLVALPAAPFFAVLADARGRKAGALCVCISFIISWSLAAWCGPRGVWAARIAAGAGGAGALALAPLYCAEIAPRTRGLAAMPALACSSGILFAYGAGGMLSAHVLSLYMAVPPCILLVALLWLPETPSFLISVGKIQDAAKVMCWFDGSDFQEDLTDVIEQQEVRIRTSEYCGRRDMRRQDSDTFQPMLKRVSGLESNSDKKAEQSACRELFRHRRSRRALFTCFVLLCAAAGSGAGAVNSFAAAVLRHSVHDVPRLNLTVYNYTFHNGTAPRAIFDSSEAGSLLCGSALVLGAAVATFTVDKLGRKMLLLWSCSGIACCLAILGVYCDPRIRMYSWYSQRLWPYKRTALKDKPFNEIYNLTYSGSVNENTWTNSSEQFLKLDFNEDRKNITYENDVGKPWYRIGLPGPHLNESISSEVVMSKYETDDDDKATIWAPVVLLSMVLFLYNIGLGSVPYVLISELFSINVRSLASSLFISWMWLSNFFLLRYYGTIAVKVGLHGAYYISALITLLGAVYTYFWIPETKGKTEGQIHEALQGPLIGKSARQSEDSR